MAERSVVRERDVSDIMTLNMAKVRVEISYFRYYTT
jgi:hypothetical protein